MAVEAASEQRPRGCKWVDWERMTSRRAVCLADPASVAGGASAADLNCRSDDACESWSRVGRSGGRGEERARDVGEKRHLAWEERPRASPCVERHFGRGCGPSWAAAAVSESLVWATRLLRRRRHRRRPFCLESRRVPCVRAAGWGTRASLEGMITKTASWTART